MNNAIDLKFGKNEAKVMQNKDRKHAKEISTNPDIKANFFSFTSNAMDSVFWLALWAKVQKKAKKSGKVPSIAVQLIHSTFETTERLVTKEGSTVFLTC